MYAGYTQASTVSIQVDTNITAQAEYLTGEQDKPLLVFIHGFLQTNQYPTIKWLYSDLNEEGYPVLAPTLSLGISNRVNALSCESIHLHSFDSDTKEIGKWLDWARYQGHQNIILIGHSAGSINITAYLASGGDIKVSKTILISLSQYENNNAITHNNNPHPDSANNLIHQKQGDLEAFSLSFCNKYITTADYYQSYANWTDSRIINAINNGKSSIYIIIGGADKRISPQWLNQLQQSRGQVTIVEGANHFFDMTNEFALQDCVKKILSLD